MTTPYPPTQTMGTIFKTTATSCACGGHTAWFEAHPNGVEVSRGCVCHKHPCTLDLEPDHVIPTKVWAVLAQRGVTLVYDNVDEAQYELDSLDDKYRPGYLLELKVTEVLVADVAELVEG